MTNTLINKVASVATFSDFAFKDQPKTDISEIVKKYIGDMPWADPLAPLLTHQQHAYYPPKYPNFPFPIRSEEESLVLKAFDDLETEASKLHRQVRQLKYRPRLPRREIIPGYSFPYHEIGGTDITNGTYAAILIRPNGEATGIHYLIAECTLKPKLLRQAFRRIQDYTRYLIARQEGVSRHVEDIKLQQAPILSSLEDEVLLQRLMK